MPAPATLQPEQPLCIEAEAEAYPNSRSKSAAATNRAKFPFFSAFALLLFLSLGLSSLLRAVESTHKRGGVSIPFGSSELVDGRLLAPSIDSSAARRTLLDARSSSRTNNALQASYSNSNSSSFLDASAGIFFYSHGAYGFFYLGSRTADYPWVCLCDQTGLEQLQADIAAGEYTAGTHKSPVACADSYSTALISRTGYCDPTNSGAFAFGTKATAVVVLSIAIVNTFRFFDFPT